MSESSSRTLSNTSIRTGPGKQWTTSREGLVEAALAMQGNASAALTPEGRLYVEDEQGSGLIGEYRRQDQVVVVVGDGNQVAVGHGQTVKQGGSFSKEEALDVLDEAEARLRDADLSEEARQDALADLDTVKTQSGEARHRRNDDPAVGRSQLDCDHDALRRAFGSR
jgi:hypothetical protein